MATRKKASKVKRSAAKPRTRSRARTVLNLEMDKAKEAMDRARIDDLVINEVIDGKPITLLEIHRKLGPLAKDNNNNIFC